MPLQKKMSGVVQIKLKKNYATLIKNLLSAWETIWTKQLIQVNDKWGRTRVALKILQIYPTVD